MTIEEAGAVLATCALYDNRKTDSHIVIMWHRVIGDLPYQDCEDAVVAHYTETTDRIMPAHIRSRVKAVRRDRLAREIIPRLPAEPDRFRDGLRASITRIADGHRVPPAIAAPVREDPPPPEFTEARARLGPGLPRTLQELARRQAAESRAARETADRLAAPGEPA